VPWYLVNQILTNVILSALRALRISVSAKTARFFALVEFILSEVKDSGSE